MKKIPARALTRVWGRISLIRLAPLTRRPVLGFFCFIFGIKLKDVKQQELGEYSSLHDFFTRVMREETRPICPDHSLVRKIFSVLFAFIKKTYTHTFVSKKAKFSTLSLSLNVTAGLAS